MKFKFNIKLISLCLAVTCLIGMLFSCGGGVNDDIDGSDSSFINDTMDKPSTPELDRYEIAEKIEPSIVKVICYDYDGKTEISQGTGFFIDKKGMFITNAHVLKDAYYIKIKNHTGKSYNVDLMYVFNEIGSDYAICRASDCYVSRPVEFATSANSGDTVYAVGYPQDSFESAITPGEIIDPNTVIEQRNYYSNNAWIDHGSSGGVLSDAWGRVLGITTGIRSNGDYVALKYQDFKSDIEKKHTAGKEPLKYFHTVREYEFNSETMENYFDIIINLPSYTDTSMDYEIVLRFKDKYKDGKVLLKTMSSAIITVKIETRYDYSNEDGTVTDSKTTTDTLYFQFNTVDELRNGKTMLSQSVYSGQVEGENYNMDISYEATFGVMQSGKIVIYN